MLSNEDIKTIENFINQHNSELSLSIKKLISVYNYLNKNKNKKENLTKDL